MVAPKGFKTVAGFMNGSEDFEGLQQRIVDGEVLGVYFAEQQLWPIEPQEMLSANAVRRLRQGQWGHGNHTGPMYLQTTDIFMRDNEPPAPTLPEPPRLDQVYLSPFMEMMLAAIKQFGITGNSFAHVKKAALEEHFTSQRLPDGTPISPNMASMMATFIRPAEATKGGQKRMG